MLKEPAYTIEEAEKAGGLGRETRPSRRTEGETVSILPDE